MKRWLLTLVAPALWAAGCADIDLSGFQSINLAVESHARTQPAKTVENSSPAAPQIAHCSSEKKPQQIDTR
jgi:hypothetical protein